MSDFISVRLYGTTDASGDLTVYSNEAYSGEVYAVQTIDGTLDDGVDITVTSETADSLNIPILTKANFNTDGIYYPRTVANQVSDGAASTVYDVKPLASGRIKMVLAQGGNAKSGGCIVYIEK